MGKGHVLETYTEGTTIRQIRYENRHSITSGWEKCKTIRQDISNPFYGQK